MFRKLVVLVASTLAFAITPVVSNANTFGVPIIAQFPIEALAQAHCPNDLIVWLNTHTGIYHFKGERWYGKTRVGAYVCEHEALRAGDRPTHNGQ